jgi:hypothetical protein
MGSPHVKLSSLNEKDAMHVLKINGCLLQLALIRLLVLRKGRMNC